MKNWYDYFLDFFNLKSGFVIYRLRNGVLYKTRSRTADKGIISEVWFKKNYNPSGFEIKNDDLVIDIGSHIGVFALFASYHSCKGRVFAFEPSPDNYSLLKENIALNKTDNIIPSNFGVCGKRGKRKLYLNEKNTGGHSILKSAFKEKTKSFDIKCMTLEDVFKEFRISYCNFMKIDCEGAEYEILMKTPKNVLKKIGKVSLEYHNFDSRYNINDLKKHLSNSGFNVIIKGNMIYAKR